VRRSRARLPKWTRAAGRLAFDGLIAVGCFAAGVGAPDQLAQYQEHAAERAIWAQLPEVHRLLPLLGRRPEPDSGRDLADGRR
jgi:hypothetical protein